jgi:YidC/Oxa1 family membrane protein insertase
MIPLANVIQDAFSPLISVFQAVLVFIHNSVGFSWGLSIIGLTVVIRLVLFPLTLSQFKSMAEMQKISPLMKQVKEKYKDDKTRQGEETMKLMKEHGVNPFASCLPLLLQLPVLISLFYMLRTSLKTHVCGGELRKYLHIAPGHSIPSSDLTNLTCSQAAAKVHESGGAAKFLFIHDITAQATGVALVVLILLYVGSQLVSSLIISASADRNQRLIAIFLPLVFVAVIYRYPSGLLLYWITTNTWTIGQGFVVRRRVGMPKKGQEPPPLVASGKGGGASAAAPPGGSNGRRGKGAEPALAGVSAGSARSTPPPPSPRKKKKRSGRRR